MHAQLVEAVSELLRERLGPTSEYVSSLIGIQAAYINTNHPEFVAGSAAIARGELPQGHNVPVIKKVSSNIPFFIDSRTVLTKPTTAAIGKVA